jgi:hypothetical protein
MILRDKLLIFLDGFIIGTESTLAVVHTNNSKVSRFTLHVEANYIRDIKTVLTWP